MKCFWEIGTVGEMPPLPSVKAPKALKGGEKEVFRQRPVGLGEGPVYNQCEA